MKSFTFTKAPRGLGLDEYGYCAACPIGRAKRSVVLMKRAGRIQCGLCAGCRDRLVRLEKQRSDVEDRQRHLVSAMKDNARRMVDHERMSRREQRKR